MRWLDKVLTVHFTVSPCRALVRSRTATNQQPYYDSILPYYFYRNISAEVARILHSGRLLRLRRLGEVGFTAPPIRGYRSHACGSHK
eukprot:8272900-Pyramimonas_sp.AAC.1